MSTSREDTRAARNWIADAFEDAPADLTDTEVVDAIRRHYDGGWAGFIADGEPVERQRPTTRTTASPPS